LVMTPFFLFSISLSYCRHQPYDKEWASYNSQVES
jgi:hypothetical protein